MSLKERLLPLFKEKGNGYLSGEEAAKTLGVSRTAVWKAISALKEDGYKIEAVTNKGYRLSDEHDVLSAEAIKEQLGKMSDRLCIEVKQKVTSTNAVLKQAAADGAREGTVIVAAEQTAGRGRFARSFFSPGDSGVYFSILLRPQVTADAAVLITTAAAVAVAEAAEALSGRKADIKWVNDVLIDNKKICGILTEAALNLESGTLDYAVLGIGVNVYEPEGGFPKEIKDKAGAVFENRGNDLRSRLAAEIISRFLGYYDCLSDKTFLASYRRRCIVLNREITVISGSTSRNARALGIDDRCRLHVKYADDTEDYLSSGEISIRY